MLSDFSMNKSLMAERREEWSEWFFTGAIYADIGSSPACTRPTSRAHRIRAVVSSARTRSSIRHRRLPTCAVDETTR